MMKVKCVFLLALTSLFSELAAQEHEQKYFPPTDSLVRQKLNWWSDIKFGLLMHWGTYSQWGIVESWSLCPEDEGWCERRGPYASNYNEYKKQYENLQLTFNPIQFNPARWANAAKDAGMKYVVFTTKHHDGFCMFDTKQTDYKITGAKSPFALNPKSNITKEIFNAFRSEGLGIGAYFSKPDWHSEYYWNPYFPPFDRNVNYDIKKYPERWEQFKQFTHNQIKELMTDYGKVDILWLDGGWVQPMTATSPRWGKAPVNQDIDMDGISKMARSLQPGLIIVDRAVEGPNQNYLTPEQQVPTKPLDYSWETCMTMANSWSYVPNDVYKPARQIIHTLCKIVSRGGNYLLNIGPSPLGDWDPIAYQRLTEIGEWMKINQEAIYSTHPSAPYETGKIVFTQKENGAIYAIYLLDENEKELPQEIVLNDLTIAHKKIVLIGSKSNINMENKNGKVIIHIPKQTITPTNYACVFKLIIQ